MAKITSADKHIIGKEWYFSYCYGSAEMPPIIAHLTLLSPTALTLFFGSVQQQTALLEACVTTQLLHVHKERLLAVTAKDLFLTKMAVGARVALFLL